MALSNFKTIDVDNIDKQLSIKVLSNLSDLYVVWIEQEKLVLQIHYSKKEKQLKLIDGSIGKSINAAPFTEQQKIFLCAEALRQALLEQKIKEMKKQRKLMIEKKLFPIIAT